MRVNSAVFWVLSLFFGIVAVAYALWSMIDRAGSWADAFTVQPEWVGTVALSLSSVFATFIAFYVMRTMGAQGGELPEDRPDADIDDGDPEVGYFSPWSWWPMTIAGGLALMFLGLAVGVWLMFIGAPIVLIAIIGWYYEYYRGNFAR